MPTDPMVNTRPTHAPPRAVRWVAWPLAIGAAVCGGTGVWVGIGASQSNTTSFAVVTIAAGIVAMLTAMGRFGWAPALALLCAGGTACVAGILSGAPAHAMQWSYRDLRLQYLLAAQCAVGMGLVALAMATPLLRAPDVTGKHLARAILSAIPLAILIGLLGSNTLVPALNSAHSLVKVAAFVAGFIVACGSAAAAGHNIIVAYERSIAEAEAGRAFGPLAGMTTLAAPCFGIAATAAGWLGSLKVFGILFRI